MFYCTFVLTSGMMDLNENSGWVYMPLMISVEFSHSFVSDSL